MCQFIESIRILNGNADLLYLHQARVDRTFKAFFSPQPSFKLAQTLGENPPPSKGFYKLRIVYNHTIISLEYLNYKPQKVKKIKLVFLPNDFSYAYKFVDRSVLNSLCENLDEYVQPIFIQNGMVTDSLFANLVFKHKSNLYTPNTPLLKGIQREYLIKSNTVQLASIKMCDLKRFEGVYLINAMMPLHEAEYIPFDLEIDFRL